jgi:hypothetical protein
MYWILLRWHCLSKDSTEFQTYSRVPSNMDYPITKDEEQYVHLFAVVYWPAILLTF